MRNKLEYGESGQCLATIGDDDHIALARCSDESLGDRLEWDLSGIINSQKTARGSKIADNVSGFGAKNFSGSGGVGYIKNVRAGQYLSNVAGVSYGDGLKMTKSRDDATKFHISNRGDLRSAQTLSPGSHDDGCIGVDRYGQPMYDRSSLNSGNPTDRNCEYKWNVRRECPANRLNGETDECNYNTGEWYCKHGTFGPRCEFKECNPINKSSGMLPTCDHKTGNYHCKHGYSGRNCQHYTCDPKSRPANYQNVTCDEQYGGWRCKTGWFGKNCDQRCVGDACLRDPSLVHDVFYESCKAAYDGYGNGNEGEELRKLCEDTHKDVTWLPKGQSIWDIKNADLTMEADMAKHQQLMHHNLQKSLNPMLRAEQKYSKQRGDARHNKFFQTKHNYHEKSGELRKREDSITAEHDTELGKILYKFDLPQTSIVSKRDGKEDAQKMSLINAAIVEQKKMIQDAKERRLEVTDGKYATHANKKTMLVAAEASLAQAEDRLESLTKQQEQLAKLMKTGTHSYNVDVIKQKAKNDLKTVTDAIAAEKTKLANLLAARKTKTENFFQKIFS